MLLRVPIRPGQPVFAVAWSPAGFEARPVAVQEEYSPGGVVRTLDTDAAGFVYDDAVRLLAPEEVYDEPAEAEFVAACLNRLTGGEPPGFAACAWAVDEDKFFSPDEG